MKNESECKSYLIEKRAINPETVTNLETQKLITCYEDQLYIAMKDIDGNRVGTQIRYINPVDGIKSKTKQGDHVGFFFTSLDFTKPIIVVEGEVDFLSLAHIDNVVGLQGVANLSKLVLGLQEKGVKTIYLLIDNDDAADKAIDILIEKSASLDGIYDCRAYLGNHNDINDYIVAGKVFDEVEMVGFIRSLKDSPKAKQVMGLKFISQRGNNTIIDHNTFSKYIVEKYNIASIEGSLFYYPSNDIRKPIHKIAVEKIIIQEMEDILLEYIEIIKNQDRNHVFEFLVTHAENSEMEKMLNQKHVQEINLYDGILNINTGEIREYSKEDYKIHKLAYTSTILNEGGSPEKWINFLNQILRKWNQKEKITDFLQEFIGWLFIPSTKFEKSVLLYGNGANGKGVFLEVIRDLLGEENCIGIGMHEINRDQNLLLLLGKLANIDSDMQQGVQLDSGIIKKIISGEHIVGKAVYQKPVGFAPYAKLLAATNELPYLKSADQSIKRRFIFIHLKQSFLGKEDPTLKERLKSEKNLIFVWAIAGLKRLLKRGHFDIPDELKNDIEGFIKENDSVTQFIESEDTLIGEELSISNKDLYYHYSCFCKENGFKPLGLIKLGNRLLEKGFHRYTNGKTRGIKGLSDIEW